MAQELYEKAEQELREQGVEKLAIFTREDDAANHLYQKWGGSNGLGNRLRLEMGLAWQVSSVWSALTI
ncbi:hypothetical protein [Streptococcus suis]|uniref:hypothetical protein n=1 Tax=Streptococcus suis TaxID=1307 RepID=UPI0039E1EF4C